jgi:predicted nucleic acid-binding protein
VTHGLDTSFLLAVEIVEHAHHAEALRLLWELLARGDRVAIAPQVLTEFVDVVTDERRFQQPFSMRRPDPALLFVPPTVEIQTSCRGSAKTSHFSEQNTAPWARTQDQWGMSNVLKVPA